MHEAVIPFRVQVTDDQIADLRGRLARTRWPEAIEGSGWNHGADVDYLRTLCSYWAEDYDWRGFEARFNAFPQYLTEIDGQPLHFYHLRSPEPGAKPLILSHGWPGSVAEFHRVMGPLADPRTHGGDPADAFHIVAPSLPGFGFSGATREPGWNSRRIARAFDTLMCGLGYETYFAQGGDKGTLISLLLGSFFPERVRAIHLNLMPVVQPQIPEPLAGLSEDELAGLAGNAEFAANGAGYQSVQRTRPQALAIGLMDSPAGLATWLIDKFRAWSDCGGDLEGHIERERLLDNISLYWLTGTIASSMQIYFEDHGPGRQQPLPEVLVPIGHAVFPREILKCPRAWAEARFNIVHWRQMPAGGHFAAMEVPELYVEEVRGFFRRFR
jgi:microsomal epoxide hydrolase